MKHMLKIKCHYFKTLHTMADHYLVDRKIQHLYLQNPISKNYKSKIVGNE